MSKKTDESILPDALSPQSYDRHHGKPESYWQERNALVDAVRSARAGAPSVYEDNGMALQRWHATEPGKAYWAALDALKAFDARNGGTPIL